MGTNNNSSKPDINNFDDLRDVKIFDKELNIEMSMIRKLSASLSEDIAVFSKFMQEVHPDEIDNVVIPPEIIKIVEQKFPFSSEIKFSNEEKVSLIYNTFRMLKIYKEILNCRADEILNTSYDYDRKAAKDYNSLKAADKKKNDN